MKLWRCGGGRKRESCDVAYVEEVRTLVGQARHATVVWVVMLAALTGAAVALVWVLRASTWVVYADR